jgi:hypothetical protein
MKGVREIKKILGEIAEIMSEKLTEFMNDHILA